MIHNCKVLLVPNSQNQVHLKSLFCKNQRFQKTANRQEEERITFKVLIFLTDIFHGPQSPNFSPQSSQMSVWRPPACVEARDKSASEWSQAPRSPPAQEVYGAQSSLYAFTARWWKCGHKDTVGRSRTSRPVNVPYPQNRWIYLERNIHSLHPASELCCSGLPLHKSPPLSRASWSRTLLPSQLALPPFVCES